MYFFEFFKIFICCAHENEIDIFYVLHTYFSFLFKIFYIILREIITIMSKLKLFVIDFLSKIMISRHN